jgi:hypothetical protein
MIKIGMGVGGQKHRMGEINVVKPYYGKTYVVS